jgi:AcrR family transcriptional regulator
MQDQGGVQGEQRHGGRPRADSAPDAELPPRARAKRAQIRAAAQELFLRHGFAATTMDAVTATAGISKQTLYRYYPSKEALFADILDQLTLQQGASAVWPPPERVTIATRADLEAVLTWLARDIIADTTQPTLIALMRVLIAEAPRFPHLKELFTATVSGPGFAAVSQLLDQARAAGVVVVEESEAAARLFIGSLLTYYLVDGLFAAEQPRPPPDAEVVAIVRLFVRAVT